MKNLLKISAIFLIIITIDLLPQNRESLDSLYNIYISVKEGYISELPGNDSLALRKCGIGIINKIKQNFNKFTPEQQKVLSRFLQRPTLQKSLVSPSGLFRVHYNETGNYVPDYDPNLSIEENVLEVAKAIDSTYFFEVNYLNYPAAPPDNGNGGDDLYDIYITGADGFYGFTTSDDYLGNHKYTSYIQIHYDYRGVFYTAGLEAMKVTLAHEYHHAIQMGNYTADRFDDDLYFYEMSSTAMEEFVFDSVNDYYAYINNYLRETERAFGSLVSPLSGYDLAIWNIYLQNNFNYDILKRQWELFIDKRALNAINTSLVENNSNFGDEYNKFGIWTYYTGYRAKPGTYFEEGANYPLIEYISSLNMQGDQISPINVAAKPTSNNYLNINIPAGNGYDTLAVLITNTNYIAGMDSITKLTNFKYELFRYNEEGSTLLVDGRDYYARFSAANPSIWRVTEFLNGDLIREGYYIPQDNGFVYPNPFRYSMSPPFVYIPAEAPVTNEVDFNVYSSGFDLVYSTVTNVIKEKGQNVIKWDAKNNSGGKLGTGVYVYVIKFGDNIKKGKIVIFNE